MIAFVRPMARLNRYIQNVPLNYVHLAAYLRQQGHEPRILDMVFDGVTPEFVDRQIREHDIRVAGITWGKGHSWETTVFDATPVSYAQAGLLPQFQRDERDVYENIKLLTRASRRQIPDDLNVPNKYLHS